jgi:hypothetical protein
MTPVSYHPYGKLQCASCGKFTKDYGWVDVRDVGWVNDAFCEECYKQYSSEEPSEQY